jgi:CRISPR system Cascade subunit CasE
MEELYLSRLPLNPRNRDVRAVLADAYATHNLVMQAWGAHEPRALYRVEDSDLLQAFIPLLVQSHTAPVWDHVPAAMLAGLPAIRRIAPLPRLRNGATLAFRLRANTAITRDGKRYGLVREDEQLEWLQRKGERHGFEVLSAIVRNLGLVTGKHPDSGRTAKFTGAQFNGYLRVTNADSLQQALAFGVGHGKGFGFGLLSLAAAQA